MLLAGVMEFTDDACAHCNDFRDRFRAYEYLWTTDLQAMFADFLAGAVLEVTQEGEDGEAIKLQMLDLDKFDERIRHFRRVQDEIREMKNHTDITFLRVNAQPIKQALSTWVTKWVYMFTQHLQEEVVSKLRSLRQFMADVDEGLDSEVSTADKEGLMKIMGHIRDVRVSIERTQAMFQPLRDTAALLKTHGLPLEGELVGNMEVRGPHAGASLGCCPTPPPLPTLFPHAAPPPQALEFLDAAPERWERTVNKTFKCRESIQPLQNQMADNIKKDISTFKGKVRLVRRPYPELAQHMVEARGMTHCPSARRPPSALWRRRCPSLRPTSGRGRRLPTRGPPTTPTARWTGTTRRCARWRRRLPTPTSWRSCLSWRRASSPSWETPGPTCGSSRRCGTWWEWWLRCSTRGGARCGRTSTRRTCWRRPTRCCARCSGCPSLRAAGACTAVWRLTCATWLRCFPSSPSCTGAPPPPPQWRPLHTHAGECSHAPPPPLPPPLSFQRGHV